MREQVFIVISSAQILGPLMTDRVVNGNPIKKDMATHDTHDSNLRPSLQPRM